MKVSGYLDTTATLCLVSVEYEAMARWSPESMRLRPGGHQSQLDILEKTKISPAGNHTIPELFSLQLSHCARCAVLAWWKLKWLVRNVWQYHFVHHSVHMDCAGITAGVVRCVAGCGMAC